jgi:hypothetical protein
MGDPRTQEPARKRAMIGQGARVRSAADKK